MARPSITGGKRSANQQFSEARNGSSAGTRTPVGAWGSRVGATCSPGQCGQGPKLLRGGGSAGTPRACGLHTSPQHTLQTRVTMASARAPRAQHTCHRTCEHTCTTSVSLARRWDISVFAHSLSSRRPHAFEVYRSGRFVRSCPRPHPWAEVGFGLSGPSMQECFLGRAPGGAGGCPRSSPSLQTAAGASQVWGFPAHTEDTHQQLRDRTQDLPRAPGNLGLGILATVCSSGQRGAQPPRTGAPSHPKARLSLPPPTGFPGSDLTLGKPRALKIKSTFEKQQGPMANSSSACWPVPQVPDFSKTNKHPLELCVHQGSGHTTIAAEVSGLYRV